MKTYMAVHTMPSITEEQAQQMLAGASCATRARLVSVLTNLQAGRAWCRWEAESHQDVEATLRDLNLPYDLLMEVREFSPN